MIKNVNVQFNLTKLYILLIIGVIVFVTILSCSTGKPEHEIEIHQTSGYYSFDPESIFKSLSQSDENTFKQIDSIDNPVDKTQNINSVTWSQEEFLYVMLSFHSFVWQVEIGDGWDLLSVEFQTGCEDVKDSFQSGNYYLFKVDSSSGRITRKTHRIVIKPSEGTIWWSESELYPVVEQWIPVDLANLKISVTDAISIADANGGQETRLDIGNDCVQIINGYHDEWRIAYYLPASNNTVSEFFINNNTGAYRKENHE